jgi:predicted methyltransferase
MSKKWDYDVPTEELWKEVLRALKPGGHLLSFASAKTYHRMATLSKMRDLKLEIKLCGSTDPAFLTISQHRQSSGFLSKNWKV